MKNNSVQLAVMGIASAFFVGAAISLPAFAEYGARLGADLMPNGRFEGTGGWQTFGDFAHVEKGAGLDGSAGLVIEKDVGPMVRCPHSQPIPAEPGLAYRIEMWVKNLSGDGRWLVPYISGHDANGRGVGNTSRRPERVTDNDPRDDGWYRVEGVTPVMPPSVRHLEVVVWADDKVAGKVAVDDISVYPVSANAVGTVVCSAYQARASAGEVTFKAVCSVNASRHPEGSYRAEVAFVSAQGPSRRGATVTDGVVTATLPVADFAFGPTDVTLCLVAPDGSEIGSGRCRFRRDREDPVRRVAFDRHGHTLLDGKPFLPLGLYFSSVTEKSLTRLREGPFNCIMPYRCKDGDLDLCHAHGIMMIGSVSGGFRELRNATPEEAERQDRPRWEKVRRLRGHPALLAWYLADEVPVEFEDLLRARNEKVHELDPGHPTWIVLDKPAHVAPLVQGYDVIGVDPYPIGNHGSADRTAIGIAAGWAQTARRTTFGFRPMWNVPQLFNWATYRKKEAEGNPGIRFPTEEEMRSMVWQSVAAGANGLVGYSFFDINERESVARETADAKWAEVCRVFSEVKGKEGTILAAPGPDVTACPTGLVVRTWTVAEGKTSVLVCNTLRTAVSGTVTAGERSFDVTAGPLAVLWRALEEPGRASMSISSPVPCHGGTCVKVKRERMEAER